jgi:hypothetical protein
MVSLLAGVGCASGVYNLSYHVSHGAAMAPPTTQRGLSTGITYREWGGPIGKALLLWATAPRRPSGKVEISTTYSGDWGDGAGGQKVCLSGTCYSTTTIKEYPPTEEQLAEYRKKATYWQNNVAPAIMSGALRVEVIIDVASTSLGGDTSGGAFIVNDRIPIRNIPPLKGMTLSIGIGGAKYTMHGRSRDVLREDENGELKRVRVSDDIKYNYAGMPLRVTGLLTRKIGLYAQLDMNLLPMMSSLLEDFDQPQIVRSGLQIWLPFVYVTGEVAADRLRPDSISVTAEAGLAF